MIQRRNWRFLSRPLLAACALVSGVARAESAPLNPDTEYVIVVLENSASMNVPGSSSATKWQLAKWRVNQFLSLPARNRRSALWTYSGTSVTQLSPFQESPLTRSALNSVVQDTLTPGAPFAAAICDAALELESNAAVPALASKRILIQSSGTADISPQSHACSGATSSAAYPLFEPESWQAKLRARLRPAPSPEQDALFRSLVDVDQYREFLAGSVASALSPLELFAAAISAESGGYPTRFELAAADTPLPRFGDTNKDGCTDTLDLTEVQLWANEELSPSQPLLRRLDVNRDGAVDNFDFQVNVSTFGCGVP